MKPVESETRKLLEVAVVNDLISATSFRYFEADAPVKNALIPIANQKLWIDDLNLSHPLPQHHTELAHVPRLSTLTIGRLFAEIVATIPPDQCYLNVGTWHGFSLFCCAAKNFRCPVIGIDNFSELNAPRRAFYKRLKAFQQFGDFRFFEADFAQILSDSEKMKSFGKVACYFYDGAHDYQSQFDGLVEILPWLAEDCYLIVDDTNLPEPRQATLDFLKCHPDFQLIADLKTACDRHPTWWNGLMLISRQAPRPSR